MGSRTLIMKKISIFASLFLVFGAFDVHAAVSSTILDHVDRGSFNSPFAAAGQWKVGEGNYRLKSTSSGIVGLPGPSVWISTSRNYFTFNIENVPGPVTSGQLKVYHPRKGDFPMVNANSYSSSDPTETVNFYGLDNPSVTPALLQNPERASFSNVNAIFQDLGDGSIFGTFEASAALVGTISTIELTQAGIDSLNAAIDADQTRWSIGGALQTGTQTPSGNFEEVFRGSNRNVPATQLVLRTASKSAPAMSGLAGFGLLSGLCGIGIVLSRRRQ